MESLYIDGIYSRRVSGEISRRFFDLKEDHEDADIYVDADGVRIECAICEYQPISWGGAFHSWDSPGDTRDITIRF